MRHLKTVLAVLGAALVLVLAGNTVVLAATGQGLVLGKSNTANYITAVKRTTPGSVIKLESANSSNPPMTVTGKGKVINLNADKVDGYDGGTRVLSWTYSGAVAGDKKFVLTGLPAGSYLLHYDVYMSNLNSDNGLPVYCFFDESNGAPTRGAQTDTAETPATFPGLSGSTLMVQPPGGNLGLACIVPNGTATWTAPSDQPLRITAVPLAGVTSQGAPTAARTAPRAAVK